MEIIAEREAEEEVEEEEEEEGEEQETLATRKTKWIAKGKANVIHPRNPNNDLPKLEEVPKKRRKLLNASTTAAATANLPQFHEAMEGQPFAPSGPVEEVAALGTEEASLVMP